MRIPPALLAATVLAACIAPLPAAAQQCQPEVTAMGAPAGPAKSDAERVARVYWRSEVARTYGSQYADWATARSTRLECIQMNADTYQCWATGTPCLPTRLIR